MNLQKRVCPIKVKIEPLGAELLDVTFNFGYDKLENTPVPVEELLIINLENCFSYCCINSRRIKNTITDYANVMADYHPRGC